MPRDLVGDGARWLSGRRQAFMARPVQYVPAGGSPIDVDATRDRTTFEVVSGESVVQVESVDWIVPSGSLPGEPRRGDRVVEVDGATTYSYEVMSDPGVPPWSWCDASRTGWRLHTKLVSTEVS